MASETYAEFVHRLAKPGDQSFQMVHGALGLAGETGEVVELIKKGLAYGKPIERDEIILECGDVEFYLQMLYNAIGVTKETVLLANMEKLNARYPSKEYSDAQAIRRADTDSDGNLETVDGSVGASDQHASGSGE